MAQRRGGQVRRHDLVHRSAVRHSRYYEGLWRRPNCRSTSTGSIREPAAQRGDAGDVKRPNGLAFSPDETKLDIVEAGGSAALITCIRRRRRRNQARQRRVHSSPPRRAARRTACAVDVDGNLWCGWGMGTRSRTGSRCSIRKESRSASSRCPERCANVCFGGLKRNRLFMAASHSVYSLYVNTQGAAGG